MKHYKLRDLNLHLCKRIDCGVIVMRLYFNDIFLGYTSKEMLFLHIKLYLTHRDIPQIRYFRSWMEKHYDKLVTVVDYGDHENFFYVEYDEGDVTV